jgi:hypothetical protein
MSAILIYWSVELFGWGGCLFALWKGDRAERMAAGAVIANLVLGGSAMLVAHSYVEAFRLVNDGLAAVALLVLAVRYAAPWLGGAMLFYAAQFALHSVYLVMAMPTGTRLHADINNLNFMGMVACLIIGTAMTWRRRVVASRAPEPFSPAALAEPAH